MNSNSDPQETLKIQQAIRQSEDKLVQWIEDAVDNKDSGDLIKNSQFRNVVRVAATTESTEVIKNFLRYQMGRDKKWGQGDNALAKQIIIDIGSPKDIDTAAEQGRLFKESHAVATEIFPETENFSLKRNNVWLMLIRLYLGYGSRHLVYRQKNPKSSSKRIAGSSNINSPKKSVKSPPRPIKN